MAIVIGNNFNYQGKRPNFVRDQFSTLEEMCNFPSTSLDEGHISYCIETRKRYIFSNENESIDSLGKWRELNDTELNESSENPVKNKIITEKFNQVEEILAEAINELKAEKVDIDKLKIVQENLENISISINTLATVARTGDYIDLINTPDIDNLPTKNSNNLVRSGGVYDTINEDELVIASALIDLNEKIEKLNSNIENLNSIIASSLNELTSRVTQLEENS